MGSSAILEHDFLERIEELSVRRIKSVRPGRREGARADQYLAKKRRQSTPRAEGVRRDSLVLNDTDPGGLLTITGTQPDIVRCGETDFNGEMDPSSQPTCVLQFEELP